MLPRIILISQIQGWIFQYMDIILSMNMMKMMEFLGASISQKKDSNAPDRS